jgi:hypothetical protein
MDDEKKMGMMAVAKPLVPIRPRSKKARKLKRTSMDLQRFTVMGNGGTQNSSTNFKNSDELNKPRY